MDNIQSYITNTLSIYTDETHNNELCANPNILLSHSLNPDYIKNPIIYIPPEISKNNFIYLLNNYASYINFTKCNYICILCAYFNLSHHFKLYFIPSKNNIYISTYYASINNNKVILNFIIEKGYYPKQYQCAMLETDAIDDFSNLSLKDIVKYDLHRVIRENFIDVGSVRLLAVKYCAFRTFNEINRSDYLYISKRPFTLNLAIFIREVIGHNPNLTINYSNDNVYTFNSSNLIVPEYIIVYLQMNNFEFIDLNTINIDDKLFKLGKELLRQFIKTAYYDRTFIHSINFKIPFFHKYIDYGS
jgi:hypothetical protein